MNREIPAVRFMNCPAYLDDDGTQRCLLPAEVEYTYVAHSTGGLAESAKIRCPLGHFFNGPIALLTSAHRPDSSRVPGRERLAQPGR